jgi:hypothetical protein
MVNHKVSGRLASHRSLLNQIHPNYLLQDDYNKYGINFFEYIVLFMGPKEQSIIRRGKELELIIQDRDLCYMCEKPRRRSKSFWGEFTRNKKEK